MKKEKQQHFFPEFFWRAMGENEHRLLPGGFTPVPRALRTAEAGQSYPDSKRALRHLGWFCIRFLKSTISASISAIFPRNITSC
jgi:hypothetical protein